MDAFGEIIFSVTYANIGYSSASQIEVPYNPYYFVVAYPQPIKSYLLAYSNEHR